MFARKTQPHIVEPHVYKYTIFIMAFYYTNIAINTFFLLLLIYGSRIDFNNEHSFFRSFSAFVAIQFCVPIAMCCWASRLIGMSERIPMIYKFIGTNRRNSFLLNLLIDVKWHRRRCQRQWQPQCRRRRHSYWPRSSAHCENDATIRKRYINTMVVWWIESG